jgi:hypothetical protein
MLAPTVGLSVVDSATEMMAEARIHGDQRAPPIDATMDTIAPPTPRELGDLALHREYEERQNQRLRAEYLRAAESRLQTWQSALELAQAQGTSAEEMAAAREKIQRLESMWSPLNGKSLEKRR